MGRPQRCKRRGDRPTNVSAIARRPTAGRLRTVERSAARSAAAMSAAAASPALTRSTLLARTPSIFVHHHYRHHIARPFPKKENIDEIIPSSVVRSSNRSYIYLDSTRRNVNNIHTRTQERYVPRILAIMLCFVESTERQYSATKTNKSISLFMKQGFGASLLGARLAERSRKSG